MPPVAHGPAPSPARRFLSLVACTALVTTAAGSSMSAFAAQSRQAIADPETVRLDSREFPATVESYWQGAGPCVRPAERLDADVAAGLARMTRFAAPATRTVRGLRFENRPGILIDAFEALVAKAPAASLAPAAGCATVACAVGRIFGEREGDRLLYLLLRYGYNASHLGVEGADAWELFELSDLLLALGDFPPATIPFHGQSVRSLIEDTRGERLAAKAGVAADAVIAINDQSDASGIRVGPVWEKQSEATRRSAVFHEVAHDYFRTKSDEAETLRRWQGAMLADAVWARNTRRPAAVSQYATGSISEDFAESATAYRYAPELLKLRAPKRYELLRRGLFDGLEYTSELACDPQRSYTARATVAAQALMGFTRISDADANAAMRACLDVIRAPSGPHSLTVGRACMGREVLRVALRANLSLIMSPADPVDRELLIDRLSNQPYLIETTASLDDAALLEATAAARRGQCGGACHIDRMGTAGRWRPQ